MKKILFLFFLVAAFSASAATAPNAMTTNLDLVAPTVGQGPIWGAGHWTYVTPSGGGGGGAPAIDSLNSTNGYWVYTSNASGNTNGFFILTNVPAGTIPGTFVKSQTGKFTNHSDVVITTLVSGQALLWDSASGTWTNATPASGGGGGIVNGQSGVTLANFTATGDGVANGSGLKVIHTGSDSSFIPILDVINTDFSHPLIVSNGGAGVSMVGPLLVDAVRTVNGGIYSGDGRFTAGNGNDVYFIRGGGFAASISSSAYFPWQDNVLDLGRSDKNWKSLYVESVPPDSGGIKHRRITTGSIGSASSALVTVTWATAFPDANYTVTASVVDSTTTSLSLSVVHVESVSASTVTVRVINNAAGALSGTLNVIALHD